MQGIATIIFLLMNFGKSVHGQHPKKNILFIASDDMRPELGVYADKDKTPPLFPHMHTPNLDALAAKSLVLKRAYVQQPLCAPSRASLLTGRRPTTTNVHGFKQNFREKGGNFTTIPQFFKNNGYQTVGLGKVFHYDPHALWNDDPISWSEPVWHAVTNHEGLTKSWNAIPEEELVEKPLTEQQLSQKAIETLQRLAPAAKANTNFFFLGVGFYKPHLPFIFPHSMFNFYPESSITIPNSVNIHAPRDMPEIGWSNYEFLLKFDDIKAINVTGDFNTVLPEFKIRELRRAYYSTVSFVDNEIGKVLNELKNLGLSENTIIVFWSDHGFHLGENGEWCKHTAFELSNWSPLMIHIPGVTDHGIETYELTEFVDIFPSLLEAAGYDVPPLCPVNSKNVELCVEGTSFLPFINKPDIPTKKAAFSETVRNKTIGYTMKTKRYRYTEWVEFSYGFNRANWSIIKGSELYDHDNDPHENENVVGKPKYAKILPVLKQQLQNGWRYAMLNAGTDDLTATTSGDLTETSEITTENPSVSMLTNSFHNVPNSSPEITEGPNKATLVETAEDLDNSDATQVSKSVLVSTGPDAINHLPGVNISTPYYNRPITTQTEVSSSTSIPADRMGTVIIKSSPSHDFKSVGANQRTDPVYAKCCSLTQTVLISVCVSILSIILITVVRIFANKVKSPVRKLSYAYKPLLTAEKDQYLE